MEAPAGAAPRRVECTDGRRAGCDAAASRPAEPRTGGDAATGRRAEPESPAFHFTGEELATPGSARRRTRSRG